MSFKYQPRSHSAWRSWAARHVAAAIKSGQLVRPTECERCGKPTKRIEAHHFAGYQHPLTISWVCRSCHRRAQPEHADYHEYHRYWQTLWNEVIKP